MNQRRYFAVLTGDIIRSRLLSKPDLDAVRSCLFKSVDAVKSWERGLVKGSLDFFRGDAWQLLLKNPAFAMRTAVFLRASLGGEGKADSRISIGVGRVEDVSTRRVSLSTGEAFLLSGHGLDSMPQNSTMSIEIPKSSWPLSEWLPVVGYLCDSLIRQWTKRQAEIVCFAAAPEEPTHQEIAKKLSPTVSKQAVTKALNGANWYVIREAIHQFEKTSWESALENKNPDNLKRLSNKACLKRW